MLGFRSSPGLTVIYPPFKIETLLRKTPARTQYTEFRSTDRKIFMDYDQNIHFWLIWTYICTEFLWVGISHKTFNFKKLCLKINVHLYYESTLCFNFSTREYSSPGVSLVNSASFPPLFTLTNTSATLRDWIWDTYLLTRAINWARTRHEKDARIYHSELRVSLLINDD